MRTVKALLVALLLTLSTAVDTPAQAKVDPKKLAEEYIAESTNDSRRLDILSQLEMAGSAALSAPLKKALGADDTRARAIDLAMLMQVRGLFDAMKPAFQAGEVERVATYGLRLQEKGAAEWLLDRWKSLDKEAAEWLPLTNALLNLPIELGVLKKWFELAKDKDFDRRSTAAHIVSRQVGQGVTDADEVVKSWPEWEKSLKAEGAPQPCAGLNLQHRQPWEAKNCKNWGFNSRVEEAGFIDCRGCAPASSTSGNFAISARVFIPVDASIALNLVTRVEGSEPGLGHTCPLSFADKKWHLEAGGSNNRDGTYTPGKWLTVGFEISRPPKEPSKHGCDITYIVDGKRVAEKYGLTGDYYKVELRVDRGYAVLGSVEYVRK